MSLSLWLGFYQPHFISVAKVIIHTTFLYTFMCFPSPNIHKILSVIEIHIIFLFFNYNISQVSKYFYTLLGILRLCYIKRCSAFAEI
ncbi:hypothetical protein CLU79DRAFT_726269 [Phycomyces nitens]|nr:hypothetical protein CLU79DRAFT_726269 [Phycomyces nitens]